MGASDLYDVCLEWKDVCLDAVATTIGGPIDHAFVSPGPPSIDCLPQLAVYAGAPVVEADTAPVSPPLTVGERAHLSGVVHLVNLTCVVVRCIPTFQNGGSLPSPADIEAAAREVDEDLWAIWNLTRQRNREGTLFPSLSGFRELFLDSAFPIPPGGDSGGWQIPLRVQLDGYSVPAPPLEGTPFASITVGGGPVDAGLAPATGEVTAFSIVLDEDFTDALFSYLELDGPAPDYFTLADYTFAPTIPAGTEIVFAVHGQSVAEGDQLWFQAGGNAGSVLPAGRYFLTIA